MSERERFVPGRERTKSHFWMISITAHALLAIIFILSPVGQSIFTRERPVKPEIIRKNEELAEVVEDIRDLAVNRLKEQVSLLEAGQDRMANNFETMNRHYQPFAEKQLATARVRFNQEATATLKRLETVLEHANAAIEDKATHMPTLRTALDEHEARIVSGMEEIRRGMRLLAPDDAALMADQQANEESQLKAMQFFMWATGTHNGVARDQKRLEVLNTAVPEAATRFQAATKALADSDAALKKAQQEEQAAKKAVSVAKKTQQNAAKAEQKSKKNVDAAKKSKDEAKIAEAAEAFAAAQALTKKSKEAYSAADAAYKKSIQAKKAAEKARHVARDTHRKESRIHPNISAEQKKIKDRLPKAIANRDNNVRVGVNILRGVLAKETALVQRLQDKLDGKAPAEEAKPEVETKPAEPVESGGGQQ